VSIACCEVDLGAPIRRRDGARLGDPDWLVIDGRSNRVVSLVGARRTSFRGRLVLADRADEAAMRLPVFVERETVQRRGDLVGFGSVLVSDDNAWFPVGDGSGPSQTGTPDPVLPAAVGDLATQTVSKVDGCDGTVREGNDVVGANGNDLGTIDEVLCGGPGARGSASILVRLVS
jgi:hypothetical protein